MASAAPPQGNIQPAHALERMLVYDAPDAANRGPEPSAGKTVAGQAGLDPAGTLPAASAGAAAHTVLRHPPINLAAMQPSLQLGEVVLHPEADRHTRSMQSLEAAHAAKLKETEERARASGYAAAKQEDAAALQSRFDGIAGVLSAIQASTREYMQLVEREVVGLALDIAGRVMKYEARIDPLFLRGAVRLALEAVREGGEIQIRVPQDDVAAWRIALFAPDEVVAQQGPGPLKAHDARSLGESLRLEKKKLVIEGDGALTAGDFICRLTTGTLDLGVMAQLEEVERSFARVLGRRESLTPDPDQVSSRDAMVSETGAVLPARVTRARVGPSPAGNTATRPWVHANAKVAGEQKGEPRDETQAEMQAENQAENQADTQDKTQAETTAKTQKAGSHA